MSLRAFYRQYEFPVVFARFSNFYGPSQQLYRIVPRTIIYGRLSRTLQLHGGGVAVRAFIHGRDVARAVHRCALDGEVGEVYHFSTDNFVSIRELVEQIHRLMGVDFNQATQISDDRPGKDAQYLMSDKKARQQLGWSSAVTLQEGLRQSIAWVDQHLEEIKTLPLNYIHQP
jgi:dTDP-glucose 4,6-dehydratase